MLNFGFIDLQYKTTGATELDCNLLLANGDKNNQEVKKPSLYRRFAQFELKAGEGAFSGFRGEMDDFVIEKVNSLLDVVLFFPRVTVTVYDIPANTIKKANTIIGNVKSTYNKTKEISNLVIENVLAIPSNLAQMTDDRVW